MKRPLGLRLLVGLARALRSGWAMLGVTVAILGALELGARWWNAHYGANEYKVGNHDRRAAADGYPDAPWVGEYFRELNQVHGRWEPFVYFRARPFAGEHIRVDAEGIRRTWNAPSAKPAAAAAPALRSERPLRIFLFGGSTMWGMGARDDHTIASELSRLLAERGQRVEVTNFGQISWVSTQEMIELLRQLQRDNHPDLVVFLDGFNEAVALATTAPGTTMHEPWRAQEYQILRSGRRLTGALIKSSALFRLLATGGRSQILPAHIDEHDLKTRVGQMLAIYQANLRLLQSVAKDAGFRARFYWQPLIQHKAKLTPYEAERAEDIVALRGLMAEVSAQVQGSSLGAADGFYNLEALFAGRDRPAFIDFCHYTEDANRAIAERMLREVEPVLVELRASSTGGGTAAPAPTRAPAPTPPLAPGG